MIKEIQFKEIKTYINEGKSFIVLAYTNMCGTCNSAKTMLNIVSETVKKLDFYKININIEPLIIKSFEITSVPCFLLFKEGNLIDKFYAFKSVTYIFNRVKQI